MNYHEELLTEARRAIRECPEQRCEIIGLLELAVAEIEEGGSPAHEYELFMGSLQEIQQVTGSR